MKKKNMRNENIIGIFVIMLLASIFVVPISAQSSSIPIKLDLTEESSTISVGEKAIITVRLLDENDKPVVTEIDVPVNLSTNLGSVASSMIIHADTNLSETNFRSEDPGIAVISAKSKGLIGDTTSIAVTSLPILYILSPSDGETVYSNTITVSGTATARGASYIDSVTVNDVQAGTESWRADISLNEGGNSIRVLATDIFGNTNTKIITVFYKTHPPIHNGPKIDNRTTPTPTPASTPASTPTGRISITTIPSGAEVRLDDFFKGITPTLVNVTEGYHKIEVTKEGYDSHSETKRIRLGDGEPEEMIIELEPITGSIFVFSTPPGASVYLDDDIYMNKITPCVLSEVAVGPHSIKLTKSGYFTVTRNVSVYVGRTTRLDENLTGCPMYDSIDISSVPSGAKVYLDDVYTADTPCVLSEVDMGLHTIKLTKSDYFDVIRNVSVSVGETQTLHENLTGYGPLSISSNPPGANVYLDGVYKGETPRNISKVVVGNHTIKLTKSDYFDVIRNVSVSVGETQTLHENLTWSGSLSISSKPSGASVYLDGDYKGKTPLDISKVVVGTHSIKLTKSSYAKVEKVIYVSAGKITAVDESLAIPAWASVLIQVGAIAAIFAIIRIIFKVVIPFVRSKLKEKYLLFSLDPSYRQHLKEGDVDEKLKKVFEDNKQPLSTEVNVSKIAEKLWEIVDGEMQYSIEDTEKRLNVYKKRSN
jgi:hypothetical protein